MAEDGASRAGTNDAASNPAVPEVRRATDAAAEPARLRLDALLAELMERAGEVLRTQGRLRSLLDAVVSIGEDLSLATVLQRIVTAACDLVDARYGALGVLSPSGKGLSDFITVGMTAEEVARIGHLPDGLGILGVLIDEPEPLCLNRLSDHPKSHGFPAGHPPMSTFLGVPVRTHAKVFGNLYLTEKADGKGFTEEDELLVVALAAAAGVAIQNAQLFDLQRRRQAWLTSSNEIRSASLAGAERDDLAAQVVAEVKHTAGASVAALVVAGEADQLVVDVATEPALIGLALAADSALFGEVVAKRSVLAVDTTTEPVDLFAAIPGPARSVGRCLLAPLGRTEDGRSLGVLIVGYPTDHRDVDADQDDVAGFAGQAGVALQLAQSQRDRERLVVLEDRDRIARDLHDLVIQRLFATGMSIQSTTPLIENSTARERLVSVVDDLDATIRDLRQAIYQLQVPVDIDDLRDQLQDIVDRSVEGTTARVRLHFAGPVGSAVPESVQPHLLAALRESLSNAVRHAKAATIDISVTVDSDVTLEVTDDGVGIAPSVSRRSGLANLAARAEELGGRCECGPGEQGRGTTLTWQVPLNPA